MLCGHVIGQAPSHASLCGHTWLGSSCAFVTAAPDNQILEHWFVTAQGAPALLSWAAAGWAAHLVAIFFGKRPPGLLMLARAHSGQAAHLVVVIIAQQHPMHPLEPLCQGLHGVPGVAAALDVGHGHLLSVSPMQQQGWVKKVAPRSLLHLGNCHPHSPLSRAGEHSQPEVLLQQQAEVGYTHGRTMWLQGACNRDTATAAVGFPSSNPTQVGQQSSA